MASLNHIECRCDEVVLVPASERRIAVPRVRAGRKKEHEPTAKRISNPAGSLVGRPDNSVSSAARQPYRFAPTDSQGAGGDHFLPALLPSHSLSFSALSRYRNFFLLEARFSFHGVRLEGSGGCVVNPGEDALVCYRLLGSYHHSGRHTEDQR